MSSVYILRVYPIILHICINLKEIFVSNKKEKEMEDILLVNSGKICFF